MLDRACSVYIGKTPRAGRGSVPRSDASLSGRARGRLNALDEIRRKWDHIHGLTQQIANYHALMTIRKTGAFQSAKDPVRTMMRQLTRAAADIGLLLADHGFALLAEEVQQMTALARLTGVVKKATVYRMRELVALVYEGIELAGRRVREEDLDDDLLRRAL